MGTVDISKFDPNFAVDTNINKDDIAYYNINEAPFSIHGVFKDDGLYRRMPEKTAKAVNEGVHARHANGAGGRVRFCTDSKYVAIVAKIDELGKMSHFALTGSIGFDLYADNVYVKTYAPPFEIESGFSGIIEFEDRREREITINFPLYSSVRELYVGLQKDCTLFEAKPYKNSKPIVYYGSSITQGGCASRPGMSYQAIVSRKFDYDYINLGFSGAARAEDVMIDYINSLEMSAFVYDYDHNAPTVEHLKNTHEKMFKEIRRVHKDIPIIMMSRPKYYLTEEEKERLKIIETTYNNAVANGDKNVYLITGKMLTKLCKDEGTVDNCHPTDFGFASMAEAVCRVLEKIEIK